LHNIHDSKIEEFPSSFPVSPPHHLVEGEDRMNSSGLKCEACLVHFKGIKGEGEWI